LVVNFVSEDAAMPKNVLILITALATFYILGSITNGQETENSSHVSEAAEDTSQVIQVVNDTILLGPVPDDTGHIDRTIDADTSHREEIEEELGGDLVERFKQPAVLGELIFGMIIGNLALIGIDILEPLKHHITIEILAEIGVIILLFEVGLESNLREMLSVGLTSIFVALIGVVAPFFLGWGVSALFFSSRH
jgi:hypothetical protein